MSSKAPAYYYKKSEFPYIYQYEIDRKPNNPGDKLKILPKEDFTAFNKTSTTKDPVKDLLHFSDTMPDFVIDVPSKFPGYNTDTSDAVKKKYIDALRNGTFQPDHTDFGYDAIGIYTIDSTNIRMAQTKEGVEIYLHTFDYDEWYISDKDLKPVDVLNFNSAAAIHSVLEYCLPSGGDKLFNSLYNGTFDWNMPQKYSKDDCTVTIEHVVGATIVNIKWK